MDFNKAKKMLDELNDAFKIVEDETDRINAEKEKAENEMFFKTLDYFGNWAELFSKVVVPEGRNSTQILFFPDTEEHSFGGWVLEISHNYPFNHRIKKTGMKDENSVRVDKGRNNIWIEKYFFNHNEYQSYYLPMVQNIDFDYVEEQLIRSLNHWIETKMLYIEEEHKKAIER